MPRNKEPFFSICIPTYNKAESLKRALESALAQDFGDYEIIISNNASHDETDAIIRSFHSKRIRYIKQKKTIPMVENWNAPLRMAQGNYIATLHDDDEYTKEHLSIAYRILRKRPSIGIYAVGARPLQGLIPSRDYLRYTYTIANVSPPSETVVKRAHKNKLYLYNEKYIYCPEVELYLDIANDGYDAYHNPVSTVIRHSNEKSGSFRNAFTWILFVDKFKIITKWKRHVFIGPDRYAAAMKLNGNRALEKYIAGKIQHAGKPEKIFEGIKRYFKKEFPFTYYKFVSIKMAGDVITALHLMDIKTGRKLYHLFKQ